MVVTWLDAYPRTCLWDESSQMSTKWGSRSEEICKKQSEENIPYKVPSFVKTQSNQLALLLVVFWSGHHIKIKSLITINSSFRQVSPRLSESDIYLTRNSLMLARLPSITSPRGQCWVKCFLMKNKHGDGEGVWDHLLGLSQVWIKLTWHI